MPTSRHFAYIGSSARGRQRAGNAALILAALALLGLCAACGGNRGASADTPAHSLISPPPAAALELQVGLPAPAQLALPQSLAPRRASFVPADQLQQAEAFSTALPHQHVAATTNGAAFSPNWAGQNSAASGLAYAMYPFTLSGYDGEPTLGYDWISAPSTPGEVYFGFANWTANRWDWYKGNAAAKINLGSFTPYLYGAGTAVVCVLKTGTSASELDRLRIGKIPPSAKLSAAPKTGLAPLYVAFNAGASSDPDGSIAEYKWDPEGTGSFNTSTGTNSHFDYTYPASGTYHAAVRVIDNDGLSSDKSIDINPANEVTFSYGSAAAEQIRAMVVCPDGRLLCFGVYAPASGGGILAFKLSPNATPDFIRLWQPTSTAYITDAALGPDGEVYVCGNYNKATQGQGGLMQKWTQAGALVWSKTYAIDDGDFNLNALTVSADSVYACGTSKHSAVASAINGLLLRTDLDGNLAWAQTVGTGGSSYTLLRDLLRFQPLAIGDPIIKTCGYLNPLGTRQSAFYAEYSEAGLKQVSKSWDTLNTSSDARSIMSFSASKTKTYVAGEITISGSDKRPFLSQIGGAAAEYYGDSGLSLEILNSVAVGSSSSFGVLMQKDNFPNNSLVLLVADLNFNFTSATLFSTASPGFVYPTCIQRYGTDHLVIAGGLQGQLPASSSLSMTAQNDSTTWQDVFTAGGTESPTVADTTVVTNNLTGLSFNRQSPDDQDALIMVQPAT